MRMRPRGGRALGSDRRDGEAAIEEGIDPDGWTRRDFLKESSLGAVALSLGAAGCSSPPEKRDIQGAADRCERVTGRKPKIAIIGGGPAALSAAFHLTAEENWQDRYEVTVYQLGWRLGGKGATGRNSDPG